jgi:hypothetical protein
MERAYFLAVLAMLLGGFVLVRGMRHLGRSLHFRYRKGKPYVPGSIRRAMVTCLLAGILLLGGSALAAARWLVRDFQPISGPTHAGRVQVNGENPMTLHLEGVSGGRPNLHVTGLRGTDWQVLGLILTFPEWTSALGLGSFHRFLAAADGDPGRVKLPVSVAEARRLAETLPSFLGVSARIRALGGAGPLPIWTEIIVTRDGYRLGGARGGDSLDPGQ